MMGVCIYATNSQYSFDMGGGGFFNLRCNIAVALDVEFGDHYHTLLKCRSDKDYANFNAKANRMLKRKYLDEDIIEFLFMPDSNGSIPHKTCKKIYDLIKNIDFGDKGFRYAAIRHNDYDEFKKFLKECYIRRRKMRWS